MTPSVIGRWHLGAVLGRGGSATVYAAEDESGERRAIKVLHPHPDAARAAEREHRALVQVAGPGLVRAFGVGQHGQLAYLVLERIDGAPLLEGLRQADLGAELPFTERWPRLAAVFDAIAATIERVHDAGIVHRDLSPTNLLLTDAGPVLVDLGLVRGVDGSLSAAATAIAGTRGYLAPELARGLPPSPAADVFSLGALLYEALAGRPAFAPDLAVMALEVARGPAPIPDVPLDVDARVRELLDPDPTRRPLVAAVRRWLSGGVSEARLSHPPLPWLGATELREAVATGAFNGDPWHVRGGPGTGKTRAVEEVRRALRRHGRAVHAPPPPAPTGGPGIAPTSLAELRARRRDRAERWVASLGDPSGAAVLVDDVDGSPRDVLDALDAARTAGVQVVTAGRGPTPLDGARTFALARLAAADLAPLLLPAFARATDVLDALAAACDGAPDLLPAALARAESAGVLERRGARWQVRTPVDPVRLAALAGRGWAPMPTAERALVELLGAVGGAAPLEVLLGASDLSEPVALEAIENLLSAGAVRADDDGGWLRLRGLGPTQGALAIDTARRVDAALAVGARVGPDADRLRARCAATLGDVDAARVWLGRATIGFERDGAPVSAIEAATALASIGDLPGEVRAAAARAARALGRLDEAKAWISGASPDDVDAHVVRSELRQLASPDQARAEAELREVVRGPSAVIAAEAAYQLGRLLVSTGRAGDGAEALRDAIVGFDLAGEPDRRDRARAGLGLALLADGRPVEALDAFEQLVAEVDPRSPAVALALNGLASAAFATGDIPRALSARDEAVARFRAADSLFNLAEALGSLAHLKARARLPLGDVIDELRAFASRFELVDITANLHRAEAEVAAQQERWDEVAAHAEQVCALAASRRRTHLETFGALYQVMAQGALGDAGTVDAAEQVAARLPTAARFNLAWEGRAVLADAVRSVSPAAAARFAAEARSAARAWLVGFPRHPRAPTLDALFGAPGGIAKLDRVLTRSEAERAWHSRAASS